ncbi:UNVERIFIED_CONTAM: hypothetical protein PYX00_008874 [Menopon gallinae]|uniref:Prickle-like protein 3 n=1 Tax=Menopon gallinae TaxID=328185 RepID=A0AAW2H946_9NEOP
MKYSCIRVLELYCKVFDQMQLYNLIVRKTCSSCKCPRESHDIYHEEWINVRDMLGFDSNDDSNKDKSFREGYSWVPPGLPSHKIAEYFQQLPSFKVPRLGSSGEKYRDKQLMIQLPKQDLALAYCKHVDNIHQSCYEDFINARNEIALDVGYVKDVIATALCPTCHHFIKPGSLGVVAPKFGDNVAWHPGCFICNSCGEILVDLTYCVHDDMLYCERHYAEQLKPRCSGCDEVSFVPRSAYPSAASPLAPGKPDDFEDGSFSRLPPSRKHFETSPRFVTTPMRT